MRGTGKHPTQLSSLLAPACIRVHNAGNSSHSREVCHASCPHWTSSIRRGRLQAPPGAGRGHRGRVLRARGRSAPQPRSRAGRDCAPHAAPAPPRLHADLRRPRGGAERPRVRDRHHPGARARFAAARLHPVPPVAAAAASRAQRHQLGHHQRRDGDRHHHLLGRPRHRHRPHPAAEDGADFADRHSCDALPQPPLSAGRGRPGGGRCDGARRRRASHNAGRVRRHVRAPVRGPAGRGPVVPTGAAGLRPRPRLRAAARRGHHDSRRDRPHLRRGAWRARGRGHVRRGAVDRRGWRARRAQRRHAAGAPDAPRGREAGGGPRRSPRLSGWRWESGWACSLSRDCLDRPAPASTGPSPTRDWDALPSSPLRKQGSSTWGGAHPACACSITL